jgi:ATP-dependent helicase/nuclease subunit A
LRESNELNEHYRLLYVALTRAEERLIMAGSLGSRQKEPKPESWYCAIEAAMDALGCAQVSDGKAPTVRVLTGGSGKVDQRAAKADRLMVPRADLPEWLVRPAAPEARPPRPLAPSQYDDSDLGEKPAAALMHHAADRGKLIHGLIERIDGARLDHFEEDASAWLALRDREGRHDHATMISQVRRLISDPRWHDLFSSRARSEVPVAALVGDTVVTGRIDRLLVQDGHVWIVDFKTTRKVPEKASMVTLSELRQMAHYLAAMQRIFPDHGVTAALLYTHAPAMIELSEIDLAPYKPV